jgi:NAD(P)-dependent dehydrogenase (short-subunit alcohol dehydrogenase family)
MTAPAGRVALVTGGCGGVGTAICESLAVAGHRVAVADLDESGAERVAGRIGGLGVRLDVTDPASVAAAAARVRQELGRVGI